MEKGQWRVGDLEFGICESVSEYHSKIHILSLPGLVLSLLWIGSVSRGSFVLADGAEIWICRLCCHCHCAPGWTPLVHLDKSARMRSVCECRIAAGIFEWRPH